MRFPRRLLQAVAVTGVVVAAASDARAFPADDDGPLGPSSSWHDPDEGYVVRGPVWKTAGSVVVDAPSLDVIVRAGGEASWSVSMRVLADATSEGELLVADAAGVAVDGVLVATRHSGKVRLHVAAGEHALIVWGRREAHEISHPTVDREEGFAPLDMRHLWLGGKSVVDATSVRARIPANGLRGAEPSAFRGSASLDVPPGWYGADGSSHDDVPCTPRGFTESTYRCEVVRKHVHAVTRRERLRTGATTYGEHLELGVDARSPLHAPLVIAGGPIVGIGGRIGDGFRMRLGYEVAVKSRKVLASGSVDTDFVRSATVAIMVKRASNSGVFGAGLGVPVRVAPDVATGLRAEGDLFFGPIGFVTSVDVWLLAPERAHATVTLLGALSF